MNSPRLLNGRVLRGCNTFHRSTVFLQPVDLRAWAGRTTRHAGPAFVEGFRQLFASLHSPGAGPAPGQEFMARLDHGEPVPIERALLEAVVAVEHEAAHAMNRPTASGFATIGEIDGAGRVVDLVWECHSGSLSRAAARAGLAGIAGLLPGSGSHGGPDAPEDFGKLLARLRRRCRRRQWSPATAFLAAAAGDRGIYAEPLAGAYLRLGHGVMQHVVHGSDPGLSSRREADAALERMFPTGTAAGIPTALVVGTRGTARVAGELDSLLRLTGRQVGLATHRGNTVAGKPLDPTSQGRTAGPGILLRDQRVDTLVCARSPRHIVQRGLRLDVATTTAILDPKPSEDPKLYRSGIEVAAAATTGPLAIRDGNRHVVRLFGGLTPPRVVLLSPDPEPGPGVRRHLSAGGAAVVRVTRNGAEILELRKGTETLLSIPLAAMLWARRGSGPTGRIGTRRVLRAMFSTALSGGLGLTGGEIVNALQPAGSPVDPLGGSSD